MAWLSEHELSKFKKVGRKVLISRHALIFGEENIEIGDNVRIDAQTLILAAKGYLTIHDHVHIASQCMISCGGGITLGNFTSISMGCKLISASDDASGNYLVGPNHPEQFTNVTAAPIYMSDYSWIGANAIMLPGSMLHQGAVLGAGGVVPKFKQLSPWSIWVGNPPMFLKTRQSEMIELSKRSRELFEQSGAPV
jgi:galactoside O-acetyltransferase